jgi:hypothetical protein
MSTLSKSQYYKQISLTLQYCQELYLKHLKQGRITLPALWKTPHEKMEFFFFSSVEDLLSLPDNDEKLLKYLGFYDLPEKTLFIPWFKDKGLQLCPIDPMHWTMLKPEKGFVRDVPYLFKKVLKTECKDLPVIVTQDPIDALLLTSQGELAIALASPSLLKRQLTYLAKLENPLIFLTDNSKQSEGNAEMFVYALEKFATTSILMSDQSVRDFIINDGMAQRKDVSGIEFIAQRIMEKNNGKSTYARNIEIIEASQKLPENKQYSFKHFVEKEGGRFYDHFAQAFRFFADLIDAKQTVEDAKAMVYKRFGLDIYIREASNIKFAGKKPNSEK